MLLERESFYEKYQIDHEQKNIEKIDWIELEKIYEDYNAQCNSLKSIANTIAETLRDHSHVHTVRTRIKDPEHLIEKVIRKTLKKLNSGMEYKITVENYNTEITDLIGIRVLHLYKEEAIFIDELIQNLWNLHEKPIIYFREGDATYKNLEGKFDFKVHPAGYRSWHYLIITHFTKQPHIAEIQVRTIFEEGWSEIDHQLRYPYDLGNALLNEQLLVLNRLAGSADELVNTIRQTKLTQNELVKNSQKDQKLIKELKQELEKLYSDFKVEADRRVALEEKVQGLEASKKDSTTIDGGSLIKGSIIVPGGILKPISREITLGKIEPINVKIPSGSLKPLTGKISVKTPKLIDIRKPDDGKK
ncbi:RelA/SpoT domain-containing protein [Bacillus sp. II_CA]|uniref:RelA/SpoT domain-containing protein n=1 Tax=Bacillus sp. II_CA TaxID=3417451 RepID=UPI003CF040DD